MTAYRDNATPPAEPTFKPRPWPGGPFGCWHWFSEEMAIDGVNCCVDLKCRRCGATGRRHTIGDYGCPLYYSRGHTSWESRK